MRVRSAFRLGMAIPYQRPLSLRGAQRRSNLRERAQLHRDCFAPLAMTVGPFVLSSAKVLREVVEERDQLLLRIRLDLQIGADRFQNARLARLQLGQQL